MSFGRKKEDELEPAAPASPAPARTTTSGDKKPAEQPVEETQAPKLSDEELQKLPQHVQDAAKRQGGGVPRAAPKGGEGTLDRALDTKFPELEPPVPPTEYRAAPTAPGEAAERAKYNDKLGADAVDALTPGTRVRARTLDPNSAPIYVGGAYVPREGVELAVDDVRNRSESHVAQLLSDPRIEVELVK